MVSQIGFLACKTESNIYCVIINEVTYLKYQPPNRHSIKKHPKNLLLRWDKRMTRLLAARRKLAESLPRDSQSKYHLNECAGT